MRDLPVTPVRGKILDANGIVLADSSTLYDIYVRPNSVKDADNVARLLSNVLDIDYDKLYVKITTSHVSEITVAKNVTRDKMVEIVTANPDEIVLRLGEKTYSLTPEKPVEITETKEQNSYDGPWWTAYDTLTFRIV